MRPAGLRSGTANACRAVPAAGTVLGTWRRQRMASLAPVWFIPALPGHQTEIRPLAGYTHRTSVNLAVLQRGTACVRLIVVAAGIVPGTRTSVVLVSLVPARVGQCLGRQAARNARWRALLAWLQAPVLAVWLPAVTCGPVRAVRRAVKALRHPPPRRCLHRSLPHLSNAEVQRNGRGPRHRTLSADIALQCEVGGLLMAWAWHDR